MNLVAYILQIEHQFLMMSAKKHKQYFTSTFLESVKQRHHSTIQKNNNNK